MDVEGTAASFRALVQHIHAERGLDFGSYKESSLKRRLQKRMHVVGAQSYGEYLDFLQATPDEYTALLDTLFINVTGFFRDPDAWQVVRTVVIPSILEAREKQPIRIWCAGVASGEESFTAAMLFADALSPEEFKRRVKIYATDLDEDELVRARSGSYTAKQLDTVPEPMRATFFEPADERFVFRGDLRRCIVFGRHDLLKDAPISRLDLLICRNTLMYFNREAQSGILSRFHFALRDEGLLFLGKSEMLLTRRSLFVPIDLRSRIFAKRSNLALRDRLPMMTQTGNGDAGRNSTAQTQLESLAFQHAPVPLIVVDRAGILVLASHTARQQFSIQNHDIGRPLRDHELSYRPVELRAPIQQVLEDAQPIVLAGVRRTTEDGSTRYVDISITPIPDANAPPAAAALTFVDVTEDHRLRAELEQSRAELERAYDELQSTNEELETTNEELQSTIEELETTNEELQSTNEELETINEELQSTNEEIRDINIELGQRNEAVTQLSAYMRSILNNLQAGVAVLDSELHVLLWNDKAGDLWGIREDEVEHQPFLELDIGLPVGQLTDLIQRALHGELQFEALMVRAHDRRGKSVECRVTAAPLHGPDSSINGVILMMEEWHGMASTIDASGR